MSAKTMCSIDGCEKPSRSRGWCEMHYSRWKTHGDELYVTETVVCPCSVAGCENLANSHGWCKMHYTRWRRNGSLGPLRIQNDDANRFWSKVNKNAPIPPTFWDPTTQTHHYQPDIGPCWLWLAARKSSGYGDFKVGRVSTCAHRFAYELLVDSVPTDKELDHLCRTRACVSPFHLEAVSHRENVLRGTSPIATLAMASHCIHGHEFNFENTYIQSSTGARQCRACHREREKKRRSAQRHANQARHTRLAIDLRTSRRQEAADAST